MKYAIIVPSGGILTGVCKESGLPLEKMQQIVGCPQCSYVERVSVWFQDKPAEMYVNEEGLIHHLPINARATAIYWTATILGRTPVPFDPLRDSVIHGTAILYFGRLTDE